MGLIEHVHRKHVQRVGKRLLYFTGNTAKLPRGYSFTKGIKNTSTVKLPPMS